LFALTVPAFAQTGTSVKQSGNITPGHAVEWLTNGVVGDGGTPAAGNFTGLGVTFSGSGICQNSAAITGPYNRLCFNVTSTGGGFRLDNIGGATGGFTFNLNGSSTNFATVTLPTTANYPGCFSGTSGNLQNCGITGNNNVVLSTSPTIASPTITGAFMASPTITGAFTATGLVTNADLVSPSVTVNGVSCTLGSSCSPSGIGTVTLGTTGISGGTNGYIEYNNNGVFGEIATIGSGSVVLATSPTLTTPTLSGATLSGTIAGSPTFSGVNTFSGGALTSTYASGYGFSQLVSYNGTIGITIANTNGGSSNASAINFPANDGGQFASIVFQGNANSSGDGGAALVISNTQDIYFHASSKVKFFTPILLNGYAFASLPGNTNGLVASLTDGKATNCGDSACTTFGTTVTGGGGSLKLLVWYNGSNWTLIGK